MNVKPSYPMSDLENHLGYWMRRVSNPVSAAFTRALQARQTSVAEWVALCHIHTRHNMTPGELADLLGMTRGAISKVLDRLESKEWVRRSAMPEDNRVQLLFLTPQGDHILPELAQIADQNDQYFFGCLTAEEQSTLRSLMQKLAQVHQWSNVPIG